MMVPKKSLLFAGAALALFGATVSAQSGKVHKGYNKATRSATIDLASGTITRGPAVNNRGATTVQDFNNGDSAAIAIDTGGGFCEWYTVGTKGYNNNQSDLMANIRFVYCSSAGDTFSGGVGGTTKLGFYEGYALATGLPAPAGTNGTTVVAFTLTGLPANTGDNCFIPWLASATGCWAITLTFGTQICFADGPIAYSWKFVDLDSCGPWSHTMPAFSCVTSCSTNPLVGPYPGGAAPVDGQGMTDFVDQYCPPGVLLSTFTFNSVPGTTPMFTGQNMRIRECSDITATLASFNSTTPPNTDQFSTTRAILGASWTATTTRVGGTGGIYNIRINDAKSPLANGTKCSTISLPSATGRNMLAGATLQTFSGSIVGTTGVRTESIPCDAALLGFYWTGQSLVASGLTVRRCTSAVEGTVGSL